MEQPDRLLPSPHLSSSTEKLGECQVSVLTLCQLDDLSDGIGLLDLRKRLNELIRTEPAGSGNFPVTGVGILERKGVVQFQFPIVGQCPLVDLETEIQFSGINRLTVSIVTFAIGNYIMLITSFYINATPYVSLMFDNFRKDVITNDIFAVRVKVDGFLQIKPIGFYFDSFVTDDLFTTSCANAHPFRGGMIAAATFSGTL